MSVIDRAIEVIRKNPQIRTSALAEAIAFMGDDAELDHQLEPAVHDGRLITCAVTLSGGIPTVEYRLSASGGFKAPFFSSYNSHNARRDKVLVKTEASAGTAPTPTESITPLRPAVRVPARAPAERGTKESAVKFNVEKVTEIFKQHGPLTSRELKKQHGIENASVGLSVWSADGTFAKLGGTPKNTVYGLPTQSLKDRKEPEAQDRPPKHLRAGKAVKKPAKRARKAGSKAAKKAWKTRRAAAAAAQPNGAKKPFRPALAADGAIIMLGAKRGDFEIPREQARGLVDLQRRLLPAEIATLVNFVTRLDNAEVAA